MPREIRLIFLIDDEDDSHFVTKLVLRKAGFQGQLRCFSTAAAGLAAMREENAPPDLLLVDINMPGTGGFDFVRRCEAERLLPNGHTTVLMFSSSNRPQDQEATRNLASVDGYLEKVLTVDSFKEIVELRNRRA